MKARNRDNIIFDEIKASSTLMFMYEQTLESNLNEVFRLGIERGLIKPDSRLPSQVEHLIKLTNYYNI